MCAMWHHMMYVSHTHTYSYTSSLTYDTHEYYVYIVLNGGAINH